jgi:type IV secretion system T-DNA border endonuclease VirD2
MKTKIANGFAHLHFGALFDKLSIPVGQGRTGLLSSFSTSEATRARLSRNAAGAPQAMVKVTSWSKSASRAGAHLDYVSRNGLLDLEDEQGQVHRSKREVRHAFQGWFLEREEEHAGRRMSLNLALSMPDGTDPAKVLSAARRFAKREFPDRQYFMVLHAKGHDVEHRGVGDRSGARKHPDHPHVHLAVKSMNDAGERLRVGPADLARFREVFAEELRSLGVAANASSCIERGVMKTKPKRKDERPRAMDYFSTVLRNKPKDSTAMRRRAEQILDLARSGKPLRMTPGEQRQKAAYSAVRADYARAIDRLRSSRKPADLALADQLAAFVATMPQPTVERERMLERARQFIAAAKSSDESKAKPPPDGSRVR